MATLFLKHKVKSYDSWRPAYDRHRIARAEAGLKEIGVFRDSKDPDELLIAWTTDDPESAREFMNSPGLQSKMKEAGVIGETKIWFAD